MRKRLTYATRNSLDLADRVQVRVIRKRLGLSDTELSDLVRKAGNSIAAIKKEAAVMRRPALGKTLETKTLETKPREMKTVETAPIELVAAAEVIASAKESEPATASLG